MKQLPIPVAPQAVAIGCLDGLLGYHLARASIPTSRVFARHIGTPFELKKVEFTLLTLIGCNERITQSKLCQVLDIAPPNLAVLCERLTGRGLLTKSRDDADRRKHYLHLTPAAVHLLAAAQEIAMTMETPLLRNLSSAERAILFRLLQKIQDTSAA